MRVFILSLICIVWILPVTLQAEKNDIMPKLKTEEFEYNENITLGYSGFGQINWRSIGAGINVHSLLFIRNFNTDKSYKNLHKNLNMDYVIAHSDIIHKTTHEYESYLGGYIFDLDESYYPFVCIGVNMERKVWIIHNDDATSSEEKVYTILGKYKATPTGAIGIIYQLNGWCYLEGNLQVYPVLPYLGFGLLVPGAFDWLIVKD